MPATQFGTTATKEKTAYRDKGLHLIRLPNGEPMYSLHFNDTLAVYRDIFDDDCYRRHGITVRDGDCILDIGANTGLFVRFLNTILTRARVFAFEPVPAIFRVLSKNVEEFDHLDVKLFNIGLSREAGNATFSYYPRFSNASTMYPDDSERGARQGRDYVLSQIHTLPQPLRFLVSLCPRMIQNAIAERFRRYYLKKESVTCQLRNLSALLHEENIHQVDLLKIDAEQSEEDILAGLAENDWPIIRQIVVEVHGGTEATQDMTDLFERRGFRTAVDPNPSLPDLSLVYAVRPDGQSLPR